uniref:Thioredoxin domain-containing protein n=1 Tax=Piliocolobus tephrosceles TaxID=591936 RepID=A0A8C9IIY0_9PRIM
MKEQKEVREENGHGKFWRGGKDVHTEKLPGHRYSALCEVHGAGGGRGVAGLFEESSPAWAVPGLSPSRAWARSIQARRTHPQVTWEGPCVSGGDCPSPRLPPSRAVLIPTFSWGASWARRRRSLGPGAPPHACASPAPIPARRLQGRGVAGAQRRARRSGRARAPPPHARRACPFIKREQAANLQARSGALDPFPSVLTAAPQTPAAKMVKQIESKAAFQEALNTAGDKLVVVDFSATWCGPCKMIKPFFHSLSEKYSNVVFLEVDVDDCQVRSWKYEILLSFSHWPFPLNCTVLFSINMSNNSRTVILSKKFYLRRAGKLGA